MMATASVIIPAYNGRAHLAANVPPLLDAVETLAGLEVIVVDDASTDGTAELLAERFPDVRLVALRANRGFAGACNAGAHAAKGEIVYFLNSDVRVEPGFLEPVLRAFGDSDVFAVGSRDLAPGREKLRIAVPFFRFGLFGHRYLALGALPPAPIPVFFVSAGHAGFVRERFLALGGFDELYRPFYWEDIDLCFRAWRRDWKVVVEPHSRVHHAGGGTIGRFYRARTAQRIYWKNRFLFTWKNVRDGRFIAQHLACLPLLLVGLPLVRGRAALTGFVAALGQLPEARRKRRQEPEAAAVSDRQVLERFGVPP